MIFKKWIFYSSFFIFFGATKDKGGVEKRYLAVMMAMSFICRKRFQRNGRNDERQVIGATNFCFMTLLLLLLASKFAAPMDTKIVSDVVDGDDLIGCKKGSSPLQQLAGAQ
jgi:hypothetical protein